MPPLCTNGGWVAHPLPIPARTQRAGRGEGALPGVHGPGFLCPPCTQTGSRWCAPFLFPRGPPFACHPSMRARGRGHFWVCAAWVPVPPLHANGGQVAPPLPIPTRTPFACHPSTQARGRGRRFRVCAWLPVRTPPLCAKRKWGRGPTRGRAYPFPFLHHLPFACRPCAETGGVGVCARPPVCVSPLRGVGGAKEGGHRFWVCVCPIRVAVMRKGGGGAPIPIPARAPDLHARYARKRGRGVGHPSHSHGV